jgi:hypothetical protein
MNNEIAPPPNNFNIENGENESLDLQVYQDFFEEDFAQLAIDKANGDYMSMVGTLCRIKAQIDGMGEYGNEGATRVEMEAEFVKNLENLFGAVGGRRRGRRAPRKSRKSKRKARKTRRR